MSGVGSGVSLVSGWRRSNFGMDTVGRNLGVGGLGQKPAPVNVLLFNHTL